MVVGAGRGPLVRASFAASQACGRAIKVYAIEKNPNAIVTYVSLYQNRTKRAIYKYNANNKTQMQINKVFL